MFKLKVFFNILAIQLLAIYAVEQPTFRYVTSYNKEGRLLRSEDVEKSTVNVLKPVIFLIGGLDKLEAEKESWHKDLAEEYLKKQVQNVFIVEWQFDSKADFSNQTKSAGYSLADFIGAVFEKTGEPFLDVHLVGVLAGSQVAGVAGGRVSERGGRRVSRITALEPAYYRAGGEAVEIGGADFVDVVHSLGVVNKTEHEGDVGFYLDCRESKDFGKLTATKVFSKSINSSEFKGVKCETVEDFRAGKCEKNGSVVFGENVDKNARGNYFVTAC